MANQAEWRKAEGISQQKLAAMLSATLGRSVYQSSVSQWEAGINMPGADIAAAVALISNGIVDIASYKRGD